MDNGILYPYNKLDGDLAIHGIIIFDSSDRNSLHIDFTGCGQADSLNLNCAAIIIQNGWVMDY